MVPIELDPTVIIELDPIVTMVLDPVELEVPMGEEPMVPKELDPMVRMVPIALEPIVEEAPTEDFLATGRLFLEKIIINEKNIKQKPVLTCLVAERRIEMVQV